MKEIIIPVSITALFGFSCFLAIKIAVSVLIFCSYRSKFFWVVIAQSSISADFPSNDVLSDLDFKLTV